MPVDGPPGQGGKTAGVLWLQDQAHHRAGALIGSGDVGETVPLRQIHQQVVYMCCTNSVMNLYPGALRGVCTTENAIGAWSTAPSPEQGTHPLVAHGCG